MHLSTGRAARSTVAAVAASVTPKGSTATIPAASPAAATLHAFASTLSASAAISTAASISAISTASYSLPKHGCLPRRGGRVNVPAEW